jgi:hypothetical protein
LSTNRSVSTDVPKRKSYEQPEIKKLTPEEAEELLETQAKPNEKNTGILLKRT